MVFIFNILNFRIKMIEEMVVQCMENKILFSLPDFYYNFKLYSALLDMKDKEPDLFCKDIKIDTVYGTFPGAIWNGGRGSIGGTTGNNIKNTIKFFNEHGIGVRFTFTNPLIGALHCQDTYCNTILEIASDVGDECGVTNSVNINSEILYKYISSAYIDLEPVWSTTKSIDDLDEFNRLSEHHIVVAYYGWNKDILTMDIKHPENVELLCNEACIPNCPKRQDHYLNIAAQQLGADLDAMFRCPYGCENYRYYDMVPKRPHYISPEQTRTTFPEKGFKMFKLSGRNDNAVNVIENLSRYLAADGCVDDVRNKLLISNFYN